MVKAQLTLIFIFFFFFFFPFRFLPLDLLTFLPIFLHFLLSFSVRFLNQPVAPPPSLLFLCFFSAGGGVAGVVMDEQRLLGSVVLSDANGWRQQRDGDGDEAVMVMMVLC
jgi:hypothetical protein